MLDFLVPDPLSLSGMRPLVLWFSFIAGQIPPSLESVHS